MCQAVLRPQRLQWRTKQSFCLHRGDDSRGRFTYVIFLSRGQSVLERPGEESFRLLNCTPSIEPAHKQGRSDSLFFKRLCFSEQF